MYSSEPVDRLDIGVRFSDLHAPWQRGSNENINGLLRQFQPKGVDLSSARQGYLNRVAMLMTAPASYAGLESTRRSDGQRDRLIQITCCACSMRPP